MFKSRTGLDMRHVPYKGAAPALAAIIGGEIQAMIGAIPSTMPHIKSGKLRALATTGAKRNALTPDLPTVAESGSPGFESIGWFALAVPAGTPRDVVDRIRNEALKALENADVRAAMSARGLDVQSSTPEELALRIQTETAAVAEIIRKVGIRPE
jgi:tripartite-type tricarboxylate transporter receptor subunit TctC